MRRPVVAINALAVNPSNAGSRTMLTELIPALAAAAPHLDLLLICHSGNRSLYSEDFESIVVDLHGGSVWRRVIHDLVRVPRLVKGRADVLVTPSNVGPLWSGVPQVAIVAAHLVLPSCQRAALPDKMRWIKTRYLATAFRRHLRGAQRVLGISDFVADGLVSELGLDPTKVRSMPLGTALPPDGPTLEGRNNDVLFVGTLYRYKAAETAIRAFAQARGRLPADARLVMLGKDHRNEAARLRGVVDEVGAADVVDIRGPVPSEELEEAFRRSGVLLMPSVCEGYGLPVAEAMAYGLPVVAADATSLPGVAGDAAVLVAAGDTDGFARALIEVLPDVERRGRMARRGVERAAELSWENAAAALARSIDEVMASNETHNPSRSDREATR